MRVAKICQARSNRIRYKDAPLCRKRVLPQEKRRATVCRGWVPPQGVARLNRRNLSVRQFVRLVLAKYAVHLRVSADWHPIDLRWKSTFYGNIDGPLLNSMPFHAVPAASSMSKRQTGTVAITAQQKLPHPTNEEVHLKVCEASHRPCIPT